jgi:hypothetical protein
MEMNNIKTLINAMISLELLFFPRLRDRRVELHDLMANFVKLNVKKIWRRCRYGLNDLRPPIFVFSYLRPINLAGYLESKKSMDY